MRLDKFLVSQGVGTRKEVQSLVKSGTVTVDGVVVKKSDLKIDENSSSVAVNGKEISYMEYVYIVMNKPQGCVSATEDNRETTVIDLLPKELRRKGLFPAGRLDKDTTGLLIITDDGDFAHKMLSPKHHVDKTYVAELSGDATEEMVENFRKGIVFADGTVCKSAKLVINEENPRKIRVTISEGKFHQVKKMFLTQGVKVESLERISIGGFNLPKNLPQGEARIMQSDEVSSVLL